MRKTERFLMGAGFAMICFFGCCMDSPDMTVPIIGCVIGCVLLAIGEVKWYFSRR